MNEILEYKGKLMKIYREFEAYFKVTAKFVFALLTLNSISGGLGYYEVLNLMSIRLFIAVVCAFIPVPMTVFVLMAIILLHLFKLSVIFAALALVVFLIMYLLYLKFAPAQGIYMLAVVALAPFNLEFAVPMVLGIVASPVTLVPVCIGIFTVKFLGCINEAATVLGSSTEIDKIVASIQSVVDNLMGNKEMLLYMITFSAVIVLIYVVRKLPFDYSWYAAIGAGALLNIVLLALGGSKLGVETGMGGVVIGTIVGALVAALVRFLDCTVDYKHKEFLEFEDDDYYYYVKAIPKLGVAAYGDSEKSGRKNKADKAPKPTKTVKEKPAKTSKKLRNKENDNYENSAEDSQWLSDISEAMNQKEAPSRMAPQDDFDDFNFSDFDDDESKF